MLSTKKIIYYAFAGAALLFVLPFLLFAQIRSFDEVIGLILQFVLAWAFLGISIYYHSLFYSKWYKRMQIGMWSLILFIALTGLDVCICLSIHYARIIHIPERVPILLESIIQNSILTFVSLLFVNQYFNRKRSEESRVRIIKLENENLQLQLNSLQQQLNPHFFFNSLNVLSELIYIDVEKSEAYINELSKVFRYILDMQRSPLVTLQRELDFIYSYFFLLKIRYDDKIHLKTETQDTHQYKIPSLSLLLLFENVIKHNAINGTRIIQVDITMDEDFLTIKNNKSPLIIAKEESLGIGLQNLNNRYKLLTNENTIIEDTLEYFCVKLPLIKA